MIHFANILNVNDFQCHFYVGKVYFLYPRNIGYMLYKFKCLVEKIRIVRRQQ